MRVPGTGPCHFVGPDGRAHAAQLLDEVGGTGFQTMVTGQKVRWVLDMMRGTEFAGRQIHAYEVNDTDGAGNQHEIVLHEARGTDARVDLTELKEQMLALGEAEHTMSLRLQIAPVRHVVFDAGTVDGFGWSCFSAAEGAAPTAGHDVTGSADGFELANEHLRVTVDPSDGTYTIETTGGIRVEGCGRLVDGGDGGDTYNYSPPEADLVIDRPDAVRVAVTERGPVRARVVVETDYTWPAYAPGDERACTHRSEETVTASVRTTLELRPGERFLRVAHEIENRARDHRLRAHFPLPARVEGSDAECAFAVVHRGLTAEGGTHEFGLPTFPSRRFVDASDGRAGLALLHDGLLEYEVVDDGRALALTLLRAVGYLSRTEPHPAPEPGRTARPARGPAAARHAARRVRGARARGRLARRRLLRRRRRVPRPVRTGAGGPRAPTAPASRSGAALRVDGAEVSAVNRVPGGLVVRVFRTAAGAGPVTVEHEGVPARGFVVDLRGRPVAAFEGSVDLRPFQIATLRLSDGT